MPLPEFMSWGDGWKGIYRTALIAERKAANEIQKRAERKARMQRMLSGHGRGR